MIFLFLALLLFIFWKSIEANTTNEYVMLASGSSLLKAVLFLLMGSFLLLEAFVFIETGRLIDVQQFNSSSCINAYASSVIPPDAYSLDEGTEASGNISSFSDNGDPYVIESAGAAALYLNYSTESAEALLIKAESSGSAPVAIEYLLAGSWESAYSIMTDDVLYTANASISGSGSPLQVRVTSEAPVGNITISRLEALHQDTYPMYCSDGWDTGFIVGMHMADYQSVSLLTIYMPYIAGLLAIALVLHYLGLANKKFAE